MSSSKDALYEQITRGMVDSFGDLYFFVGEDLKVTDRSEKEFFEHLKELVRSLHLSVETNIYEGMIRGENGVKWPCRKYFGRVKGVI